MSDEEGQEVFIISAKAQVVRINLEDVKVTHGRYTQGVIIWRDRGGGRLRGLGGLLHRKRLFLRRLRLR